MGWTYQQYASQPNWFVTLLKIKYETEADYEKASSSKS